MRSMLTATLILAAFAGQPAEAQMTAPSTAGAKPKTVTTTPIRPGLQTPADTANAMAQGERLALQSDLAWVGQYNGAISGEVSERMVTAIKEFQKARGGKQTGVLNPQERGALADTAKRRRENVGWKIVTDAGTGVQLGIPGKLVPQQSSDANGTKWSSPTGTIQVLLTRRKEAGPTAAKLADREKKEPPGRTIDYTVVKPDFFVLSGMQGLKKFYIRGTFKGDEVRILTILYDQATENTVEPVVIAMSSAFNPFPSDADRRPPPRKTVEYSTGVVVSEDGAVVADRQVTDGCLAIAIAGFGNADRVAEDKEHDLALLRIYGARGLKPLNIASGAAKSARRTDRHRRSAKPGRRRGSKHRQGIADRGRKRQRSRIVAGAGLRFLRLGRARCRRQVCRHRPVEAGGGGGACDRGPGRAGVLVSADTVREFLKAHDVNATGTSTDARAAVVRVICVRK